MTALAFLMIPVVIVSVGCFVIWIRSRSPNTLHSGIESFQREMQALSPEEREQRRSRLAGRR